MAKDQLQRLPALIKSDRNGKVPERWSAATRDCYSEAVNHALANCELTALIATISHACDLPPAEIVLLLKEIHALKDRRQKQPSIDPCTTSSLLS